ncbi:hypothetical protein [Streptomyces catenulae]|uniref:Uncharacterized protein n=1 Tax=Streptomyces catenulae TaxID=66875 RepID=A0ABV2YUB6_9ACTN|nr:hypothetical protein [Streptomyces catenulae]
MAVAVGACCGAPWATAPAAADAPAGGVETHRGLALLTIDNSHADSWLEVDRTLNVLAPLSKGTAGSDHDGGGGAIDQRVESGRGVTQKTVPHDDPRSAADGEEDGAGPRQRTGAATGGDDPEGDADHDDRVGRRTAKPRR